MSLLVCLHFCQPSPQKDPAADGVQLQPAGSRLPEKLLQKNRNAPKEWQAFRFHNAYFVGFVN